MDFEIEGDDDDYDFDWNNSKQQPKKKSAFFNDSPDDDDDGYNFAYTASNNKSETKKYEPFSPIGQNLDPRTGKPPQAVAASSETAMERAQNMLSRYSNKSLSEPTSNFRNQKIRKFNEDDMSMSSDEADPSDFEMSESYDDSNKQTTKSKAKTTKKPDINALGSKATVMVSMGESAEEDESYMSAQDDAVEPPPMSLKKQVTKFKDENEQEGEEDHSESNSEYSDEDFDGEEGQSNEESAAEIGESTHLSQTVDTELEASGSPLRRSVYSGHQRTTSQQSTPSRHESSDGEGEGDDPTRSRLSESYSPGENNASYSRLVYGNEDEEEEEEDAESVRSGDVDGSRNSSKPKVFSFADLLSQSSWDADRVKNNSDTSAVLPSVTTKPSTTTAAAGLADVVKSAVLGDVNAAFQNIIPANVASISDTKTETASASASEPIQGVTKSTDSAAHTAVTLPPHSAPASSALSRPDFPAPVRSRSPPSVSLTSTNEPVSVGPSSAGAVAASVPPVASAPHTSSAHTAPYAPSSVPAPSSVYTAGPPRPPPPTHAHHPSHSYPPPYQASEGVSPPGAAPQYAPSPYYHPSYPYAPPPPPPYGYYPYPHPMYSPMGHLPPQPSMPQHYPQHQPQISPDMYGTVHPRWSRDFAGSVFNSQSSFAPPPVTLPGRSKADPLQSLSSLDRDVTQQPLVLDLLQELRKSKEEADWAKKKLAETIVKLGETRISSPPRVQKPSKAAANAVSTSTAARSLPTVLSPVQPIRSSTRITNPPSAQPAVTTTKPTIKFAGKNSEDEVSEDDYSYSSDFDDEGSASKTAAAQKTAKVSSSFAEYHDASFESESAESYTSSSSNNAASAEERKAVSEEKGDGVTARNKINHNSGGQQNSSNSYSKPSQPQQPHLHSSNTEEDRRTLAEASAATAYGLRDRERVMNPMRESLAHSLLASQELFKNQLASLRLRIGATNTYTDLMQQRLNSQWDELNTGTVPTNKTIYSNTGNNPLRTSLHPSVDDIFEGHTKSLFTPAPSLHQIRGEFEKNRISSSERLLDVLSEIYPNMTVSEAKRLVAKF